MVPRKLLHPGEEAVIRTRRHPRALVPIAGALLLITIIGAMLGGFASRTADLGGAWGLVSQALLALVAIGWGWAMLRWVLRPFFAWVNTHITLTNQRFFIQRGRSVQHIPLLYINGVWFKPTDRMPRAPGTLVVKVEGREATFRNVPDVAHVADSIRREAAAAHQYRVMVPYGL
ncbi:hypothetical protein HMPREF3160_07180 [Arthrobacter sp. HMSC06H05]|uniref:DUF304 domain-containing protein n=1 Tax=Pseudoglutamicibacter albus DNF00011 TaxID=1401063 RepID=A0A095YCD9_9MICC|nr:hypothetical protein HMPREF2128_07860 [Pseudoglutamicibacter albus DNF00011]OFT23650.1 hypothetical protein HMPREF3175_03375 [Arthrobacter sp. HMSC08H08]OFT41568.1 hypothetical protein HMPREF3160_07180 [Arthrobacter sp. HMSC06H05]